jgi:MFS transporter, SHS family, lactate transporter
MPIHLRPSTVSLIKKWHVDGANAQSSRLPTGALGKSTPLWIVCALGQESCDVGEAAACTDRLPDERLPTEIRATASAFCYHQGAIFGGFVPLILTFLAEHFGTGLAEPTVIGTWIGCVAWAAATFYGPETKDKVLVPDLVGA